MKSVDVLKAIRWVAESWDAVKKETIIKCFRELGIIGSNFTVVSHSCENHDPFDDVDAQEEFDILVSQVCPSKTHYPVNEYINGDNDVVICVQCDDVWDEHFFQI